MKKMKNKPGDIQSTIMVAFSVISTLIMVCMGMMVYWRFSGITQQNIVDNNRKMMDQTVDSIENYLVNMRQISDAAYYDVIKENDIREQNESIHKGLNLLYEANKENLRSIAIYNGYGSLMAAEPVVAQKEEPDVTRQGWFMQAKTRMENIHFSTPHVHALLVGHGERGDVHHVPEFRQHFVAFLQQFRVAESDCGKLFGSEIPVTEHPLETVHIDVCDVAHHQDGLLHLAGVLDQIVHRFEGIVILLALLIDFHRLLKVAHHVRGGLGGMDDVFGGIDDALR